MHGCTDPAFGPGRFRFDEGSTTKPHRPTGVDYGAAMRLLRSPLPSSGLRAPLGLAAVVALALAACAGSSSAPPPGAASSGGPGSAGPPAAIATPSVRPSAASTVPNLSTTAGPAAVSSVRFPGGLLIADRGNGRLLVVDAARNILWRFPTRGSLPAGQRFSADDAFLSPDGKTIVANDEQHQVIDRIDIRTRKVVWQYGHYGRPGRAKGFLHNPDDAYPLANGDVVVADIVNCRIIEISPARQIVRTFGRTGVCVDHAPFTYGFPNGDTPLPDGGLLITEIHGSRVVRLSATGRVVFDIHVPARYPSDAQLDANGNVIVADYSNPGAVLAVSPRGRLLWRYAPRSGPGRLDHPSLATPLADGTVSVNDDFRQRIVVIDPRTMRIVWQDGRTDGPGGSLNRLFIPDGHQPLPAGTVL